MQRPSHGFLAYNEFKDIELGIILLINQSSFLTLASGLSFHDSFLDFAYVNMFHKNLCSLNQLKLKYVIHEKHLKPAGAAGLF